MRLSRLVSSIVLSGFVMAALPATAWAAEKVVSVITVKVTGDRQAYLDKVKVFQGISKRLGVPAARLWRGTFAGPGTDLIFIVTEHASMAAMVEANDKLANDAEATKLLRDLDASGLRTVVDRSLMVEATP
jgi:hypothetical protein